MQYCLCSLALLGGAEELVSGYNGHGSFMKHVKDLMRCLLAMPRHALTQHNLSERTWSVLLTLQLTCSDIFLKSNI